jgi:SET domain
MYHLRPKRSREEEDAPEIVAYTLPPRLEARLRDEIADFHRNMQEKLREIADNERAFLRVESIPNMGLGCRASAPIPRGTVLTYMSGVVVDRAPRDGNHSMSIGVVGRHKLVVDSTRAGTSRGFMHLVNHACPPFSNCAAVDVLCDETGLTLWTLVASRDIAVGEQVTYTYGGGFWKSIHSIWPYKRGYSLVMCACNPQDGTCPNEFARHERRRVVF